MTRAYNVYVNFVNEKVETDNTNQTRSPLQLCLQLNNKSQGPQTLYSSKNPIDETNNYTFCCELVDFEFGSFASTDDWAYKFVPKENDNKVDGWHFFLAKKPITLKGTDKIYINFEGGICTSQSDNNWMSYDVFLKGQTPIAIKKEDSDNIKAVNFTKVDITLLKLSLLPTTSGTILNNGEDNSITIHLFNNGDQDIIFNDEQHPPETILEILYYIDNEIGGEITRPDALSKEDTGVRYAISGAYKKTEQVVLPDLTTNAKSISISYTFDNPTTIPVGGFLNITASGIQTTFKGRTARFFIIFKDVPNYASKKVIIPVTISAVQEQANSVVFNAPVSYLEEMESHQGATFDESATFKDTVTIEKDILVNGSATFDKSSTFKDTVTIEKDISVNGSATFDEPATFKDTVTIEKDITVNGSATFDKSSTFKETVSLEKDITVQGSSTLQGDLTAKNGFCTLSKLTVNGYATFDSLHALEGTCLDSDLTVSGISTLNGALQVGGITNFLNKVDFMKIPTFNGASLVYRKAIKVESFYKPINLSKAGYKIAYYKAWTAIQYNASLPSNGVQILNTNYHSVNEKVSIDYAYWQRAEYSPALLQWEHYGSIYIDDQDNLIVTDSSSDHNIGDFSVEIIAFPIGLIDDETI